MVYSTRRFVLCLSLCHFVLVFFSPFSIMITSLGEERAKLTAFRSFVRFVLVWICRFPLPLGVWEGLRFVIVALPGLFLLSFICVFNYIFEPNLAITTTNIATPNWKINYINVTVISFIIYSTDKSTDEFNGTGYTWRIICYFYKSCLLSCKNSSSERGLT